MNIYLRRRRKKNVVEYQIGIDLVINILLKADRTSRLTDRKQLHNEKQLLLYFIYGLLTIETLVDFLFKNFPCTIHAEEEEMKSYDLTAQSVYE